MSKLVPVVCLALWIPLAVLAEIPHVENTAVPRDGTQVLELVPLWERGGEEDDLIFGAIRKVLMGPDENLYVLDTQLAQVGVFGREGELQRYLSREGEGPGETRRPEDIVFLPDDILGIAQYIGGKIVTIDLEGVPKGTLMPPGFDPQEGGALSSIRRARHRAGVFVVNGVSVVPTDDGMARSQYLVRCDDQARPIVEYLRRTVPSNLMRDGWNEKRNYFPSHERWDLDGEGRMLAATERNEYRITVYGLDGDPEFSFGRDQDPWRRTEAEKQELRDAVTVLRDGERVDVEVHVEQNEAAILALYWRPNGEVWVVTAAGRHDQRPGIMQTYDVFSPEGEFIRQVEVQCPGDPDEDRLFLLGSGHAALVRGAVQARRNAFGGSRGEEKEAAVHDLLVYKF